MTVVPRRETKHANVRLLVNDQEVVLAQDDPFFASLPSTKYIRILNTEYDFIPTEGLFTHFNLQVSYHKVGEIYVLPRILEPGYFDGAVEKLPLLSFTDVYYVECVEVREYLGYKDLADADFEFSMSNIKNVTELQQAIIARYSKSMPKLSKEELLHLGVSKTVLKILGKI